MIFRENQGCRSDLKGRTDQTIVRNNCERLVLQLDHDVQIIPKLFTICLSFLCSVLKTVHA